MWQTLGRPDRRMSYFGPRSLVSAGLIFICTRVRWGRCLAPAPFSRGSRATSCARSSRRQARTVFWLNGSLEFYDDDDNLTETFDVFWYIDHYLSYCKEHGLPVNSALFV
jgi:hypothetical protein